MSKRKYLFVIDDSDTMAKYIFADLISSSDIDIVKTRKRTPKTKLGKLFQRTHCSHKLNQLVHLPGHFRLSELSSYHFDQTTEYVILFTNGTFIHNDDCVWQKLKRQHSNIKLVAILLDSLDIKTNFGKITKQAIQSPVWDAIYTYDLNDAKKYHLKYLNECYYSDLRPRIQPKNISTDTYFIGRLKPGKESVTYSVLKTLEKNGLKNRFELWLKPGDEKYYNVKNIPQTISVFKRPKDYLDILQELQETNCIIEILQTGQQAPSLRYYEAVMFNKKLLTNNQNVKDLNFYNPRYIKTFKTASDIDIDWLKKTDKVNYHYHNEFSPLKLIQMIERDLDA